MDSTYRFSISEITDHTLIGLKSGSLSNNFFKSQPLLGNPRNARLEVTDGISKVSLSNWNRYDYKKWRGYRCIRTSTSGFNIVAQLVVSEQKPTPAGKQFFCVMFWINENSLTRQGLLNKEGVLV